MIFDLFHNKRENKWREAGKDVYEAAYHLYGGSVITHPDFIEAM